MRSIMANYTPPPPNRAQTPPTPLHGPIYNSPRRSSRIHNQRKSSPALMMESPTTAPNRKRANAHNYHQQPQAPSPPSSPISPHQGEQRTRHRGAKLGTQIEPNTQSPVTSQQSSRQDIISRMLPTPAKTPRKRPPQSDLRNTARVLFHDLETDPEQIMPTPSKSRKSKNHAAFSLESFEEEQANANKVQIYTDSKERMPEMDEEDDNPFVVKKDRKQRADHASTSTARGSRKTKHGMNREVDDAVNRDEGMVYTFRGKKIYRKFSDKKGDSCDPVTMLGDQERYRREAGTEARRPLTRSSVKPRLLFPPKKETPAEHPDLDAEEATTDIESPTSDQAAETDTEGLEERGETPVNDDKQKASPFDSWPRTKPARPNGRKRAGEPIERAGGPAVKRSRSVHS